ncbi:hypothetical protein O9992_09310 [Vibrio lentus]|nr:hypothetical protein [Vibrio lentus]
MQPAEIAKVFCRLRKAETRNQGRFKGGQRHFAYATPNRFHNGNPDNDNSHGRSQDGQDEIGTFHGGDLAGLTENSIGYRIARCQCYLDYLSTRARSTAGLAVASPQVFQTLWLPWLLLPPRLDQAR